MNCSCSTPLAALPNHSPKRLARLPASAFGARLLLLALVICAAAPFAANVAHAQPTAQGGYAIAATAAPIDFRLLHAQANLSKKDYVLSPDVPPVVYPLGENFYRLELKMKRNSRKSWRGDETVKVHFFYDGMALTFFGDRNGNERPDSREKRQDHLIRHKHEMVTEGNRSFMRSVDLHVELFGGEVSSASSLRSLKLHFIFM